MTVATAYKRHSIRGVRLRGDIHFHGSERNAPESMKAIDVKMPKELAGMHFRMQVSAMDCTGCGNCADVCPAKEKALVMKPFESQLHEAANWGYAQKSLFIASLSDGHWQSFSYKDSLIDKKANVKNSQFAQPLFQVRYNSLMKTFPEHAEELFVATERNAKLRYEGYKKLSEIE